MDICPICHADLKTDKDTVVIVKHAGDGKLDQSRVRGHYFHMSCLQRWKQLRLKDNLDYTCPLDRDNICSVHKIPDYKIMGLDLNQYDQNYYKMVNRAKLNADVLSTLNDIDETDRFGKTLAYYACMIGNYNLVTRLLRLSASFHIANLDGFTPLMIAICQGHIKIALKLLANKGIQSNIHQSDNKGMCAFYYACKYIRHPVIVDFLARGLPTKHQVRQMLLTYRDDINKIHGKELLHLMTHYLKNYEE